VEQGSGREVFTVYPIIFTIIIGYYRTIIMIHNDIVCVENSLAVNYITSQNESGSRRGVEIDDFSV
jgi:hypothetical protein